MTIARTQRPLPVEIRQAAARIRAARNIRLLLDYDGTLVPFAPTPDRAAPDGELRQLLVDLTRRPRCRIHLVSGRSRESLDAWFGGLNLDLHAEHGAWHRRPASGQWRRLASAEPIADDRLVACLTKFVRETPGSLLESKAVALAWHYRAVDPSLAERQVTGLVAELRRILDHRARVVLGHKVIEVLPHGVDKGLVVRALVEQDGDSSLFVAVGDDLTDEDMFAALPPGSVSIHVGVAVTRARCRLTRPESCRRFLREAFLSGESRAEATA